MERTKYILIIFLLFSMSVNAQTDYKKVIYNAFIGNNMTEWKSVIDEMNLQKTKTNDFILELVNYQYGYIAWCIGNDKTDTAEKYLELANDNINYLEKQNYKMSYVNSYKSALLGFEIGISWYKAPFIGLDCISKAQKAIDLDKNNPFGYIQYANAQYYMPFTFGGSKTVAIDNYKLAQTLMEENDIYTTNNWNYLSLLTIIAQAYTETENYPMAKEYYEKILKSEPNYSWVKNDLYPNLLQKIKKL